MEALIIIILFAVIAYLCVKEFKKADETPSQSFDSAPLVGGGKEKDGETHGDCHHEPGPDDEDHVESERE